MLKKALLFLFFLLIAIFIILSYLYNGDSQVTYLGFNGSTNEPKLVYSNPTNFSVVGSSYQTNYEFALNYPTEVCRYMYNMGVNNFTDSFFNKTWYYSESGCYYIENASI